MDCSDLRISKLGNDERIYGSRVILPILIKYWIIGWEINIIFGTGREEARADEAPDRHQA